MNATGMNIAKQARKAAQHNPHAHNAPADAPVTRIKLPGYSATPKRVCAMSAVAGSAARSYDRPRHTTLTMRVVPRSAPARSRRAPCEPPNQVCCHARARH